MWPATLAAASLCSKLGVCEDLLGAAPLRMAGAVLQESVAYLEEHADELSESEEEEDDVSTASNSPAGGGSGAARLARQDGAGPTFA